MGKLIVTLFCLATLAASGAPGGSASKSAAKAPVPVAVPVGDPARHAGADPAPYIAKYAKIFAIQGRAHDPFGQPQDPDAKPAVVSRSPAKALRRIVKEVDMPLEEIVRQLKVTTVMPRDRRFIANGRSFSQGDRVPLGFRGKTIPTQIAEVTTERIVFRNTETNETGVLKLNVLPQGMTQGIRKAKVPGMVRDDANAPLEIQVPPSVGSITQP